MKFTDLPKSCPECGEAFSSYFRPQRKLQKKAWLLFLAGIALTFPWGLLMMYLISLLAVPGGGRGRGRVILVLIVLIFAPAVALGALALKMRKVITLNCRHCRWREPFLIDNRA